jgi:ribosomal RNA methyltransferase Nop2
MPAKDKKKVAATAKVVRVPKRAPVPEPEPSSSEEESEDEQDEQEGSDSEGDEESEEESGSEEEEEEMPNAPGVADEDSDSDDSDSDTDALGKERAKILNSMDPSAVRVRIDETLKILANLKLRKDKTMSRADLLYRLSEDLSDYFGYLPELSDLFLNLLSPQGCLEFMETQDKPRPLVIRTNTLKSTRKGLMEALSKRGATVEAVPWSKVAIKVTEAQIPIGATPEYLAGHYMLQSAASLNPVMALAPKPGERVLDMSSAPGGKTTYIAQLMKNSGTIVANDLKPQRQRATVANLHRMGAKNCIVCCYDGRKVPTIMKGFDRVLLDAPCSGLGVISREQSVKIQRTVKDSQRMQHLQ